jgi:lipopolysaccharide/colanic/teichoic acid biosynthesis glycosyltransferase
MVDSAKKEKSSRIFYLFWKRVFDVCSSFLLFILILPLFLLISLLVFITNPGPIFFKDRRIGKNAKTISVLKFRSMYTDAEANPQRYLSPEQMRQWRDERKVTNDPRITPFGRFLRKSSLDELPQLINIFFGTMSVVGPRPITEDELSRNYSPEERKVLLSAKPGLLGYWQVYARNDAKYETGERQKMELFYFQKRGIFFDLKIIFMAIPSMFKHKGK